MPVPLIPMQERAEVAMERLPHLKRLMARCRLCPQHCNIRRYRGERGECGIDAHPFVSSSHLHPGEEPVISGRRGSGTVFFSGCNLACLFCQNYPISQLQSGEAETVAQLAERFLELQRMGAHNINLVTPTPQIAVIVEALIIAWQNGLSLPIAYNCGGYESVDVLRLLDGLIDIYMPDMKYGQDELGTVSGIADYSTRARAALKEMHRQVGDLEVNDDGIAVRGMIVRHLVLPNGQSGTPDVLRFLAQELGTCLYISLMSQYYPSYKAEKSPQLNRRLHANEYEEVEQLVEELGLVNGWVQPFC